MTTIKAMAAEMAAIKSTVESMDRSDEFALHELRIRIEALRAAHARFAANAVVPADKEWSKSFRFAIDAVAKDVAASLKHIKNNPVLVMYR